MADNPDLPWQSYTRSRLPRGFSHAIGRDQVEHALRQAGAVVDDLSFGPPFTPKGAAQAMVFDVYWVGDGRSRMFEPRGTGSRRLLMRWQAVPATLRPEIAPAILTRWLPEACAWAAAAPDRGNAWSASDHRWMLVETKGVLSVEVDPP